MQEDDAIRLFKCLSDRSRLQILKSLLQEDMYVERLAGRLALTPATISFHLKRLEQAGAVVSRKEQYYTMYSIRQEVFSARMIDIIREQSSDADAQTQRDQEYRQKVIATFFEYGKLRAIPAQRKKEIICLEEIAKQFAIGVPYDERQVNEILTEIYDDYCTIRRDMIGEGIFTRDGSTYMRVK